MVDIFTIRFREVLKNTTLSQTELAKKIGISKQCISDFKSGKSYPSIQTLKAISKLLNISTDYLLGLEDEYGNKTTTTSNLTYEFEYQHGNTKLTHKEKQ